jgi:hypothetical protein
MFRLIWPSSCVYDVLLLYDKTDKYKKRQSGKHIHKNQKINKKKTQHKNTNGKHTKYNHVQENSTKTAKQISFKNIKVKHDTYLKMVM